MGLAVSSVFTCVYLFCAFARCRTDAAIGVASRGAMTPVMTVNPTIFRGETDGSAIEPPLLRLADRGDFPKRVRDALQGLLTLCGSFQESRIAESMAEFEKQLIRLADKATNEQQNRYFDSVHEAKRG